MGDGAALPAAPGHDLSERRGDGPREEGYSTIKVAGVGLSVALSALFAVPDRLWALRFALVAVALLVSIHVLRIKTFRRTEDQA